MNILEISDFRTAALKQKTAFAELSKYSFYKFSLQG